MLNLSREPTCPNAQEHTPCPEGYIQWDSWAARMSKTHKQTLCPGCGRWRIWIKKPPQSRAYERGEVHSNPEQKRADVSRAAAVHFAEFVTVFEQPGRNR
jgi:hypothetical protein